MFEINFFPTDTLAESFNNIPKDPFTPGTSRSRRLCNFDANGNVVGSSIALSPNANNEFVGDSVRNYAPIEEHTLKNPQFDAMIQHAFNMIPYRGPYDVHQLRLEDGPTAYQGIHRDGYEYVVAFVVNVQGKGGNLQVWSNDKKMLVNARSIPGLVMLWHDRAIMHNATPINGTWDGFVLTFNKDK